MAPNTMQSERARYLRALLAFHGWTQSDLGRFLGVSQQAAGNKMRGLTRLKEDEMLALADAFGVEPGTMLRPPQLDRVLGSVASSTVALATCTFGQVRWSGRTNHRSVITRFPQINPLFYAA